MLNSFLSFLRIILVIFLMTLICMVIQACDNPRRTAEALFLHQTDALPKYNFKSPDAKYLLPYILEEISGLSYVSPGVLACIQDEDGKIFFYNHQEKKIIWEERFGKSGDYEGVEIAGNTAYVINSNGNIYSFKYQDQFRYEKVKKIKTPLRKSNDVEGLAYDSEKNMLIIACKGDAGIKKKKIKGKRFYSYSLSDQKFNPDPVFSIRKKDIKLFLETYKDFEYEASRINFRPSGIALHPISKLYYIIASTGKLLLIVDMNGNIKGSVPIDPRLLGQPEGICFSPNGDLFISSEGQGDKGYILKFGMKK